MKVDGIASANVTLKRGVAHIALKPGNAVTLARVRRVIRQAGYTPQDAVITVHGTLSADRSSLLVPGSKTAFRLMADEKSPDPFEEIARTAAEEAIEVTGRVPAPLVPDAVDTLEVRAVRRK